MLNLSKTWKTMKVLMVTFTFVRINNNILNTVLRWKTGIYDFLQ